MANPTTRVTLNGQFFQMFGPDTLLSMGRFLDVLHRNSARALQKALGLSHGIVKYHLEWFSGVYWYTLCVGKGWEGEGKLVKIPKTISFDIFAPNE